MTPRISVLMPCFNHGAFIGEAIDSVLTQTFQDFEIIVVDDRSADRTPEILQRLAAEDSRLQVKRVTILPGRGDCWGLILIGLRRYWQQPKRRWMPLIW